jgi:hypothetical protein
MKAAFIETTGFTTWVTDSLPDEVLASLQQTLMANPNAGDVMPGCGGLRKVRVSDPKRGKGKRSGGRVIYLYVPEAKWFFLLDIYDKDEKADLTASEKKELAQLADELRREAKQAARR